MDCLNRIGGKEGFEARTASRNGQPLLDVPVRVLLIKGCQVSPESDSLLQRSKVERIELQVEFGLAPSTI